MKFKKVMSLILSVLIMIGVFSTATPVLAAETNAILSEKEYQENLLSETVDSEEKKAEIVSEIPEKRGEYSKTYKRADGSFSTVYSQTPLHTFQNGKWKEIDNTLKSEGEILKNADGSFEIEFPETISENEKITVRNDGETIAFSVNNIESSSAVVSEPELNESDVIEKDLSKTVSEITYESIDENTDVQYIVSSDFVKENIIVSDKESLKAAYSFDIEKGSLNAVLDEDNNLEFRNEKNEIVFMIPAPVMKDSNNEASYDIDVAVENADKEALTLIYTPSAEWLNSRERSYPVTIDPVISVPSENGRFISDTVIRDGERKNINYSNDDNGLICNTKENAEVLVKFNIEAFEEFKASNIVVTEANFVCNSISRSNSEILLKEIAEDWDVDSVTYETVYSGLGRETDFYCNEILDFCLEEESEEVGIVAFNITDLFNGWLSGEENNGFGLIPAEDSETDVSVLLDAVRVQQSGTYRFNSVCVLDYVDASGCNSSYEYLTQEIGRAGTASVNTFSRGLSLSRSDLGLSGNILPVDITFNYNASYSFFAKLLENVYEFEDYTAKLCYGNKWLPSLVQGVFAFDETTLQFFTAEGSVVEFNLKIDEAAEAEAYILEESENQNSGYEAQIINQENGVEFSNLRLLTPDGCAVYYNEMGLATAIYEADSDNLAEAEKIRIQYGDDLKIDYVTDGVGRKYDFSYNGQGLLSEVNCLTAANEQIKAGTTETPLKVTYSYDSFGNLVRVTYPDGYSIAYSYDNSGNLTSAENIDGYLLNYSYDSFGKVTNIAEYSDSTQGNTIQLTQLSNRQVRVNDAYNGTETYQFGKNGQLHYTFDDKGNFFKSDYAPSKDENVYSSSEWEIASENLLENGSFEKVENNKAQGWNNSFPVEDINPDETLTDYACRISSTEKTTLLQTQTIYPIDTKTLTFSVDAKSNLNELSADNKLYIKITAIDEFENEESQALSVTPTENFERYSVTLSFDNEAYEIIVEFGLKNKSGDFTVNNAQLERGYGTAEYNHIENGSFNCYGDIWNYQNIQTEYINGKGVDAAELIGGLPTYTVENDISDHISSITQNVKINGKKGDVYSVGGWFKGLFDDSEFSISEEEPEKSIAQIKVTYNYSQITQDDEGNETQETVTENFSVDFAPNNEDWQYAVDSFALKGDAESVDVTVIAKNILDNSYITRVALTKDSNATVFENDEYVEEDESISTFSLVSEMDEASDECPCVNCEEFNCGCQCASESVCTCVQCKRSSVKEYDEFGNVISTTKSDGVLTMTNEVAYSTDGNYMTSAKDENNVTSSFVHNPLYDTSLPLSVSVAGQTSNYTFNSGTHLESVNKNVSGLSSGNQMNVLYQYNKDKISAVTHNGFSYYFNYNSWGNIASEKVNNQTIVSYLYGSNQYNKQLNKKLYKNGQEISYGYDEGGNVNGIKYNGDSDWRFTFDYTNSERTTITDKVQNHLKEITENGYKITDLLTDQIIYSKTDLTETFNGATYTKTVSDEVYEQADGSTLQSYVLSGIANSSKTLGFSKLSDWFGRDKTKTVAVNGSALSLEKEFKYKDGAENNSTTKYIEEISNTVKLNDAVNSSETLKYTYDIHGNVKTVSSCINNETSLQYEYFYDETNQIVRVDDYLNNLTTVYQYDVGGNIVSAKEYLKETYSPESVALSEDAYVYDSSWKDKISSVNGKAMTYDLIGNLLTYDGKTHSWIAGRKLSTFQNADYSLSFTYDENGLRSSKTVTNNGVTKTIEFTWVEGQLIGQSDGTNTLRFIYDDSEEIVGFVKNDSQIYLYIKNIFGDVIGIVNETGSTVVEYEYDVWGKLLSVSGSLSETLGQLNPVRYRGYYYDSESGYYYLQSRYYDPELRRFINADKLESLYAPKNTYLYADSVNVFSYCANSPVNMVDYSGEKEAVTIGAKIVTALVFLLVVDSYNKAFAVKTYADNKKGKLEINLEKKIKKVSFYNVIFSFYESIGDVVFDAMAVYATDYFYQNYAIVHNKKHTDDRTRRRPFLFDDWCVSFEIEEHVYGYWYANDIITWKTYVTTIMCAFRDKESLSNSCKKIDIKEQDAIGVRDRFTFGYYEGIRKCYKNTKADPFWVGGLRNNKTINPYWIKRKISTDMLY